MPTPRAWAVDEDPIVHDNVWAAIYDEHLNVVVAAQELATNSANAIAATDGSGFVVAWGNYSNTPTVVQSAYIASTGTVTPITVPSLGGSPSLWTMVTRDTQPPRFATQLTHGIGENLSVGIVNPARPHLFAGRNDFVPCR